MKFRLTTFDVVRICGYVIATGALLTPDALHQLGLPQNDAAEAASIIGRIVLAATLISNVIRNPSPPAGTVSAVIPVGSIPAVGEPTTEGGVQVAQIAPGSATVRQATTAAPSPPPPKAPP